MSRGRPKIEKPEEQPRKFTRVYEDDSTIETWTYDLNKRTNGPISVDIKYKNGIDKKWVREQNEQKRVKKEMKQIVKAQKSKPKQTRKRKIGK